MSENRKINVGDIYRELSEVVATNRRPIFTYVLIFVPLTTLANWLDVRYGLVDTGSSSAWQMRDENGAFGFLVLLASLAGQYVLFERLLFTSRDAPARAARMLGFVGLAIVSFLGVVGAAIFLIIPGLFVASRWLMCPAFYVGEEKGVFEALGASWERTRGNTGAVMLAIVLFVVVAAAVGSIIGGIGMAIVGGLPFFSWIFFLANGLASETWTVLIVSLSVGTYRLLGSPAAELADAFT